MAGVNYDIMEEIVHLSVPVYTESIVPQGINYLNYEDGYDSNGEEGPFYDAVVNECDSDTDDDNSPLPPANEQPVGNHSEEAV